MRTKRTDRRSKAAASAPQPSTTRSTATCLGQRESTPPPPSSSSPMKFLTNTTARKSVRRVQLNPAAPPPSTAIESAPDAQRHSTSLSPSFNLTVAAPEVFTKTTLRKTVKLPPAAKASAGRSHKQAATSPEEGSSRKSASPPSRKHTRSRQAVARSDITDDQNQGTPNSLPIPVEINLDSWDGILTFGDVDLQSMVLKRANKLRPSGPITLASLHEDGKSLNRKLNLLAAQNERIMSALSISSVTNPSE